MSTDPIFSNPRLVKIYDAFDSNRDDLLPYVELVKEHKASKVTDLGCGTGVLALRLVEDGVDVTGVDPAKASIDIAKSKPNANKANWVVGGASALVAESADLVVMTGNVAQAIVEPEQWDETLRNVRSALKPGGHLIFETRNPDARAWEEWNKEESFQSIPVHGLGLVDGWVELTKVALCLV